MNQNNLGSFIWSVADTLRGDFRQSEYGRVILPFTVLRRIECVLEPTRDDVISRHKELEDTNIDLDTVLPNVAGHKFYNVSPYRLSTVGETSTRENLADYINKFSIFLREPENMLFGYWEYTGEDFEADAAMMAADPRTQEWWDVCMPCQEPLSSAGEGEWWAMMEEVFHHD